MRISDWSSECALPIFPTRLATTFPSGCVMDGLQSRFPLDGSTVDAAFGQQCGRVGIDLRNKGAERGGSEAARRCRRSTAPAHRSEEHTSELQSLMRI